VLTSCSSPLNSANCKYPLPFPIMYELEFTNFFFTTVAIVIRTLLAYPFAQQPCSGCGVDKLMRQNFRVSQRSVETMPARDKTKNTSQRNNKNSKGLTSRVLLPVFVQNEHHALSALAGLHLHNHAILPCVKQALLLSWHDEDYLDSMLQESLNF
jgi:hypothetical protein